MDLSTTADRMLAMRSTFISSRTIEFLTLLFLKIDMHFTHPLGPIYPANHPDTFRFPPRHALKGYVGCTLRETLLGERGLVPLWRVLRGWGPDPNEPAIPLRRLDVLKLWVRHYYDPGREEPVMPGLWVMGVPFDEVGTVQREGTGQALKVLDLRVFREMFAPGTDFMTGGPVEGDDDQPIKTVHKGLGRQAPMLVRIDQLVMRESVRREMKLWENWVSMMLWGWFDPIGRRVPIMTVEQMYRVRKGLPALEVPKGAGAAQSGLQGNGNGQAKDAAAGAGDEDAKEDTDGKK